MLILLDFDGVLCHSARECGETGCRVLEDMKYTLHQPREDLLSAFEIARPCLETGYEATLIVYLLDQKYTCDEVLERFQSSLK
eukprot:m.188577 g.188577  ORF g.188577 m.188577 type:complete len:83 (+) comp25645_c0_seq7:292-540(+)